MNKPELWEVLVFLGFGIVGLVSFFIRASKNKSTWTDPK